MAICLIGISISDTFQNQERSLAIFVHLTLSFINFLLINYKPTLLLVHVTQVILLHVSDYLISSHYIQLINKC